MIAPLRLSPRFYKLSQELLRHTFQRFYRLEITGLQHWPTQGPVVLCPKHQRWEDIPVVGLSFPRPLYFFAKVELFRSWLSRTCLAALGGVPLDRQCPQATLSTFRSLRHLLLRREHMVLFPEGTYVPGEVGHGKHRLIQLLLKAQGRLPNLPLTFVPIGIVYRPARRGYLVQVRLGPPLTASQPAQAPDLTQALMAAIGRLSASHRP